MNRAEFMAALEAQLRDITTEERDEALKFYNEYLDEAGPENEAAVLAEAGQPPKGGLHHSRKLRLRRTRRA